MPMLVQIGPGESTTPAMVALARGKFATPLVRSAQLYRSKHSCPFLLEICTCLDVELQREAESGLHALLFKTTLATNYIRRHLSYFAVHGFHSKIGGGSYGLASFTSRGSSIGWASTSVGTSMPLSRASAATVAASPAPADTPAKCTTPESPLGLKKASCLSASSAAAPSSAAAGYCASGARR
eukprot:scaffold25297_cov40-Tisochrysis_lutea.AAC.2